MEVLTGPPFKFGLSTKQGVRGYSLEGHSWGAVRRVWTLDQSVEFCIEHGQIYPKVKPSIERFNLSSSIIQSEKSWRVLCLLLCASIATGFHSDERLKISNSNQGPWKYYVFEDAATVLRRTIFPEVALPSIDPGETPDFMPAPWESIAVHRFVHAIRSVMQTHVFFKLENGIFGIGPQGMDLGDEVSTPHRSTTEKLRDRFKIGAIISQIRQPSISFQELETFHYVRLLGPCIHTHHFREKYSRDWYII